MRNNRSFFFGVRCCFASLFIVIFCLSVSCVNNHSSHAAQDCSDEAVPVDTSKIEIPGRIAGRAERLITHLGYTVSYNKDWKIPNWVAYELTATEVVGEVPRDDKFMPDPQVPAKESAVTLDYKGSGYDRGHMAPAADMKWSKQAMSESFYLSNICPQNHNLNAGIWKSLEDQTRDLAVQKGNIYVVCGPIVSAPYQTIGEGKVVVPDGFYKVLLQKNDAEWHAIAFKFDNISGRRLLSTYALSVDELEALTGIDFFPQLPDDVEQKIEREVDFAQWTVSGAK